MWLELVIDLVALMWPFGRGKSVEVSVGGPDASTRRVERSTRAGGELGRFGWWRHAAAGMVVLGCSGLAFAGLVGAERRTEERFEAKQVTVTPTGDDGVTIREVVDEDFGAHDRHGYERIIPNDFGEPTQVPGELARRPRRRFGDPDWRRHPHPGRRSRRHGQWAAPLRAHLHPAQRSDLLR